MSARRLQRRTLLRLLAWTGAAALAVLPRASQSTDIYLQIQRGEKVMVALPPFNSKGEGAAEKNLTAQLHEIAKQDLLFSRLFNLTESGPSVETARIDFQKWGEQGADLLIVGNVTLKEEAGKGGGSLQLIASVFETPEGKPIFQKIYRAPVRSARRLAHEFVADFLYRFTGNRGLSLSRIAFANDATGSKELYCIDYDGENLRRLTADKSIDLLPRWSPDGGEILYTTFRHGNPDLAIYSFEQGKSRTVSRRRGLNSAASFSPDGKALVVTLSFQGSPNLYLLDRKGGIVRRLTQGRFADTSASFSPDGRKIAFVSDRPGWPQIYMMDADGSHVERLTDSGYCDSPVWSPLGDKIAFSRGGDKGRHEIVVYDVATGQMASLTPNAGSNENPSFSPDGRFLVFSTNRDRKRELYVVSIDGTVQKKLAEIPGNSTTPSWGPVP